MADTIDPVAIAKTNKGRGILERSSKRRLVCLKQGNNVRSGLKLGHLIFFIPTSHPPSPPPPQYGRPFYVVFVVGTIEECIRGVQNEGLDGGIQMSVVS